MQTQVNEDRLDGLVLAWLWCQRGKVASATAVATGAKAVFSQSTKPELADLVKRSLARLVAAGHVARIEPATKRGQPAFRPTPDGERRADAFVGRRDLPAGKNPFAALVGSDLTARAVGLPVPPADKKSQTAFGKLLPVAVATRHHGVDVPLDRGPDVAKLALVKLALSRANGVPVADVHLKTLPTGELPARISGLLLGQPANAAKDLDKLLETAAAGALGVTDPTPAKVKSAVVRHWLLAGSDAGLKAEPPPEAEPTSEPEPPPVPAADVDPHTFVRQVHLAAAEAARAGSRGVSNLRDKVLADVVWHRYQQMFEPVPLDRFKQRLSAAGGQQIELVREDRVPDDRAGEFHAAEVRVGASVYHYVRVRD